MGEFIECYKHRPHEGLDYYTPAEVFEGRYERVRSQRPQRGLFQRGRTLNTSAEASTEISLAYRASTPVSLRHILDGRMGSLLCCLVGLSPRETE
jgi:hypothetical protein